VKINRLENISTAPIIKEISFSEISDFWSEYLWAGRQSVIEPVSSIDSNGDINTDLRKYNPRFWGIIENNSIVSAISSCQTEVDEYRLRGICVHPNFRSRGYSTLLIHKSPTEILISNNNSSLWTLSREHNLQFYKKFGFEEFKRVTNFEFGPHVILKKQMPE
jgi:predicted GNAT family acetyltransferase